MRNPYHFRTVVNRFWRIATDPGPGPAAVRALDALSGELKLGSPGYDAAQRMLRTVDAYDYARHLLRDLYDAKTSPSGGGAPTGAEGAAPAQTKVSPAQAGAALQEEEPSDEDDDPL